MSDFDFFRYYPDVTPYTRLKSRVSSYATPWRGEGRARVVGIVLCVLTTLLLLGLAADVAVRVLYSPHDDRHVTVTDHVTGDDVTSGVASHVTSLRAGSVNTTDNARKDDDDDVEEFSGRSEMNEMSLGDKPNSDVVFKASLRSEQQTTPVRETPPPPHADAAAAAQLKTLVVHD